MSGGYSLTDKRVIGFKALVTLLIGTVYFSAIIWALLHDKLDITSFIAGVGPFFGVVLRDWFGEGNKT